jgi:predicted CXXCH cytochrome family protein
VVLDGRDSLTCLSCHDVHQASVSRHEKLDSNSALCATCHESKSGKWTTKIYDVHSKVCGY